jgi:hypothetical protein
MLWFLSLSTWLFFPRVLVFHRTEPAQYLLFLCLDSFVQHNLLRCKHVTCIGSLQFFKILKMIQFQLKLHNLFSYYLLTFEIFTICCYYEKRLLWKFFCKSLLTYVFIYLGEKPRLGHGLMIVYKNLQQSPELGCTIFILYQNIRKFQIPWKICSVNPYDLVILVSVKWWL